MHGPSEPRHPSPSFGKITPEHTAAFIGIMNTLHNGPTAQAFGRLLQKRLEPDDYTLLAHLFEEISVLALHHLVPEALLFDAFAFDLYWDELREDVLSLRAETGNEKFCENFELAAERARDYRQDRPPKLRWKGAGEDDDPPRGGGGGGFRVRRPGPPAPSSPLGVPPEPQARPRA